MILGLLLATLLVVPSLGARLPHIIGGNDVETPGKYPWQGSLQLLKTHSCGCSLISSDWVITAAHCILEPLLQSVVFGLHDINTQEHGQPERYQIEKAIVHPYFNMTADGFPNDIALIKLRKSANLTNDFIGTVTMAPAEATDADYGDCMITGWGAVKMIGGILPSMPNVLQEAPVGVYSKTKCESMLEEVGGAVINDGHVCVGEEGLRGACSGDSGGPLVCMYKGLPRLVGLTSWGVSTCNPKFPSVYTRVSHFRSWIDEQMKPEY